jgi:hypothetical protein
MNARPVDLNGSAKVIFSVLRKGATTGTNNYNLTVLYQRYEFGALSYGSKLTTVGAGSFGGSPDYIAANADSDVNLRVTNVPSDLIAVPGGMIYVAEIYSTHSVITPLTQLGVTIPTTLYSITYF